ADPGERLNAPPLTRDQSGASALAGAGPLHIPPPRSAALSTQGKPPALPGWQKQFDVSGSRPPFKVPPREPPRTRRNFDDGRVREPKSHEVGVQIPCRVHSQVPPEDPLWRAETASGWGLPQARCAEGGRERGRPPPPPSRPYDGSRPAEICGIIRIPGEGFGLDSWAAVDRVG